MKSTCQQTTSVELSWPYYQLQNTMTCYSSIFHRTQQPLFSLTFSWRIVLKSTYTKMDFEKYKRLRISFLEYKTNRLFDLFARFELLNTTQTDDAKLLMRETIIQQWSLDNHRRQLLELYRQRAHLLRIKAAKELLIASHDQTTLINWHHLPFIPHIISSFNVLFNDMTNTMDNLRINYQFDCKTLALRKLFLVQLASPTFIIYYC